MIGLGCNFTRRRISKITIFKRIITSKIMIINVSIVIAWHIITSYYYDDC